MFLLIHVFANSRKVILIAFKFHYVSINSILQRTARNYLNLALNSIMFLLILVAVPQLILFTVHFKFHYVSINSIVRMIFNLYVTSFKFHYVSINSSSSNAITVILSNFKFHYVSINSLQARYPRFPLLSLNSIMFLLIQRIIHKNNLQRLSLNSIMFLLILFKFTFHLVNLIL